MNETPRDVEELTNEFISAYSADPMGAFIKAKDAYLHAISKAKNFSIEASRLNRAHGAMSQEEFQDSVIKHFGPHLKKHSYPRSPSASWLEAEEDLLKSFEPVKEEYDTGEGNRQYFKGVQQWAQAVEDLEAEVDIQNGVYVAHGAGGEVMGEFDAESKTGWLVTRRFTESLASIRSLGMTFKSFLFEEDIKAIASKKAMDILGSGAHRASEESEKELLPLLDTAKQERIEKVNSPIGPWMISLFKTAAKTFVAAYPPKAYGKDPIFFVKD